ncbi:unnamed protein product [Lampetra planeri]
MTVAACAGPPDDQGHNVESEPHQAIINGESRIVRPATPARLPPAGPADLTPGRRVHHLPSGPCGVQLPGPPSPHFGTSDRGASLTTGSSRVSNVGSPPASEAS